MERFNRYEEEVLFEQKINEIQETNEFKLFAKEDPTNELLSINLASSFRAKENFDLPKNSFFTTV